MGAPTPRSCRRRSIRVPPKGCTVTGSGLRRRALLLLPSCSSPSAARAAPGAADGRPGRRVATCFGRSPARSGPRPLRMSTSNQGNQGPRRHHRLGGERHHLRQAGDDLICGNGGHDMIFSGKGRDRIQGGRGNDILYGEEGNDTLQGGPGGNILNGGLGTDRCLSGDTYVSCELPSVDEILAECPTKREIARIDAEFDLSFEGDLPAGRSPALRAGLGLPDPPGEAGLQRLADHGPHPLRRRPPLDAVTLEDWFAQRVDTIRFRDDIAYSSYGPAGVINIQTGWPLPASQATDLWIDPEEIVGLAHLMILMVHEARHADLPHNCDGSTGSATPTTRPSPTSAPGECSTTSSSGWPSTRPGLPRRPGRRPELLPGPARRRCRVHEELQILQRALEPPGPWLASPRDLLGRPPRAPLRHPLRGVARRHPGRADRHRRPG